jgi:hypothetical protein
MGTSTDTNTDTGLVDGRVSPYRPASDEMPKTYYWAGNVINAAVRQIPYTPPSGSYVALYTMSPTPAGGGVEVATLDYSREQAVWTAPVNGQSSNVADIVFPVAETVWGTIVAWGLVDAPVAGNLLYFANLGAPQFVQINNQIKFPAGQLQILES